MKGLFNDDTSSIIVRDALRMNDKGTDAANKGEVGEGQKFLESAESNLLNRIKQRRKVEPDISAALMIVWNSLSLIHKKQNDYLSCFKRLMRIQRVESLITISPLEAATTKLNLALCCHSLGRPSDSLTHSAGALEILSVQLMDAKDESSENEAHRRKLILNYILTLFNRGVHYLALGDTDKFKLNLTQSLELATQKFGKEESITTLIKSLHDKEDKSSLKPFFINKSPDIGVYLNKGIGRRISLRDIDIRGNRRGKDSRDTSDRNEEENVTISRPRSSNRLPPINSRDISRETSQVGNREVLRSSGKGSINTGDPSKARQIEIRSSANQIPASSSLNKSSHQARDNNTGHRSVTKTGKNNPKPNESTADASVFGERNENQHLPNVYALSRIRVALKYMK